MEPQISKIIAQALGASEVIEKEMIQILWSGYGKIFRVALKGASQASVVVKHVRWPSVVHHPVGWQSDFSHQRKVRSYEVETAWYQNFSTRCDHLCRVPRCLAVDVHGDELLIILEDLDEAGFPLRKYRLSWEEIALTLRWLANFHATFMGEVPTGLWKVGTYWHLHTRPDEFKNMNDEPLRCAAGAIDKKLNHATFKTLVHGDAKVANFCFAKGAQEVAAVDFQYVGGGCGMKDVAYFLGSCLHEDECEYQEKSLLKLYFDFLEKALYEKKSSISFSDLVAEWSELYHFAWVDFHRFMKGWSAQNWHADDYSERLKVKIVSQLKKK